MFRVAEITWLGLMTLTCLTVVAGLWLFHPKGADVPLQQILPDPVAGTRPVTWVALGSSLSAGPWPAAAASRINRCTGRQVNAVQMAGPGQGSDWGLAQIPRVIAAKPEIVTLEFTINDADLRRGITRAESRSNHLAMIEALQTALPGVRIVLLRLGRAHGLRAGLRPMQGAYDAALVRMAARSGVGIIDLRTAWRDAPSEDRPDGLHPTREADLARTAPAAARALAPLIARVPRECGY